MASGLRSGGDTPLNRNIRKDDPEQIYRTRMMAACPSQGEVFKFMTVRLLAGENIKSHKHAHHLVMYYPELAEPILITPQPGTMLYLPPGTLHEVPPVKRERVSIAMLFNKEK